MDVEDSGNQQLLDDLNAKLEDLGLGYLHMSSNLLESEIVISLMQQITKLESAMEEARGAESGESKSNESDIDPKEFCSSRGFDTSTPYSDLLLVDFLASELQVHTFNNPSTWKIYI